MLQITYKQCSNRFVSVPNSFPCVLNIYFLPTSFPMLKWSHIERRAKYCRRLTQLGVAFIFSAHEKTK